MSRFSDHGDRNSPLFSFSESAYHKLITKTQGDAVPHLLSSEPLHDPTAPVAPDATTRVACTTCYMCACRCGIRVHLRDGEVRYIDGNPDHPLNQGVICAKGSGRHHEAGTRRRG
jgi:anaerobic selenocysteine-containing dehydrogenase